MTLRLGKIVKQDNNPLMLVSPGYEAVAKQLASHTFSNPRHKLLACLVVSQTEKRYKRYMVLVLKDLSTIEQNIPKLIDLWQQNKLEINDADYEALLTEHEWNLLKDQNFEAKLDDHPELFNDGFSMAFYPTMKKAMIYWRRLVKQNLAYYDQLNSYQKLVLHFVTAQMLVSWESSCIDLGLMLLDDWGVEKMAERFDATWPIYRLEP